MRIRTKKYTDDELENSIYLIREPEANKGIWNKGNPLHVEIGCGKGAFITTLALRESNVNFVALERASKIIVRATKKASDLSENGQNVDNLRFVLGDAANLLELFAENEIDRIYLNFSDPWPNRKKWQKKRLTHRSFLEMYKKILKPGGEIHLKTDNEEYFQFSLKEFEDMSYTLSEVSLDLHSSEFHTSGKNIMTEYEKKFSSGNIFRLVAMFQ